MLLFSVVVPFCFPPWSSCHWNKGRTVRPWCGTCPCSLGSEGEESGALRILLCLRRHWACSVTSLRNAFELLPDLYPIVCVRMEFSTLLWGDAQCVRGGRNGAVSAPWRSISNLPCAMIIWVLEHASLPSSAHCLPHFPLIVPAISGSDMEPFQRGAARQDSLWEKRGVLVGCLCGTVLCPPSTCRCTMIYQLVVNGAHTAAVMCSFLAWMYLHFPICLHLKFQRP